MTYDVAILGAGCAGLSLATRISERMPTSSIVILDSKTAFCNDRTWCFWNTVGHPFEAAIRHSWNHWTVATPSADFTSSCSIPYNHIPASAFYEEALRQLSANAAVDLRLGETIDHVGTADGRVHIRTTTDRIEAGLVFDSRPRPTQPASAALVQDFLGLFVRTTTPTFDPATVTLMDFSRPSGRGVHFHYLLPFSTTTALVESTWFGPTPLEQEHHEKAVAEYLHARLGVTSFSVTGKERGVLPMSVPSVRPRSSRVIPIGVASGAYRPSTGYAFCAIQKQANEIVDCLASGRSPARVSARTRNADRLDAIFLSYLSRYPKAAPGLFLNLFRNSTPERLVRFLTDTGSLLDYLNVVTAMPRSPMARETLHVVRQGAIA